MQEQKKSPSFMVLRTIRDGNGHGYNWLLPVMTITDIGRSKLKTQKF